MNVYVGIDLHRKRSQVAILESDGTERVNRNLRNDSPELMELLELLRGLPAGTPVAFEAAYGLGRMCSRRALSTIRAVPSRPTCEASHAVACSPTVMRPALGSTYCPVMTLAVTSSSHRWAST